MADNYTYTLGYLRSRLRTMINEATALFYSDAQLNAYINEAIGLIAEQGMCIQSIDTVHTTPNTRTLTFSGFRVEAVEYVPASGRPVSLRRITQRQIGRVKVSGITPQYFYELGSSTIGIEPKPTKEYDLNLYVYDYPSILSSDSTVPDIPIAFRPLILPLAYSIARAKEQHVVSIEYMYSVFVNELNYLYRTYIEQRTDSVEEVTRGGV